ncbi:Cell number regulator 6 [Hordeum vulgare]|nr:Cell number regulator 6 [Hordeum vulgare]
MTPQRSSRVLAFAKPSPPIDSGLSRKGKRCGIKRKGGPTKVNKGCKKRSRVNTHAQDDDDFDAHDEDAGDDCFDKIDSNISRPLMGHIYTKIDPSTMILDMGEPNKKLHITTDDIHHLFGFPQGGCTPPRPSEDGFDDAVMRRKAKLGSQRSDDIRTKDLRNILKHLVKDDKNDDLAF